ncbi:HORMA domain-containing protein 1 isoform X2 [Carcharodon carcharias]|uniref:HORMA domain-containing protein 1 isoform X2 n=1 Tax=Carcharodon carcharias TaxID=13397 RepID=UPI001B7E5729|nr:HORMA domain-containing protein 1 isoform X2 [Carcharodon carcharias]
MAVVQMQKSAMGAAMFPSRVTTEQQSLVLVKRLLAVAISCITYLRGLFPEHAYGTRYLEDLCVKILREDENCPGSSQIVKWMLGCYDALQKKYTITECYQFKFKYLTIGPTMDFASNNRKISSSVGCSDTRRASIQLIRKLYVLMQSLGPLPNDICLKMKLSYYDEVTPPDYQPPGFKEGSLENMMFEGEPVFLSVGEVTTPFHVLKVKVTTQSDRMEQLDKDLQRERENIPPSPPVELDQNEQVEINDTLPAESPAASQVVVPENSDAEVQSAEAKASPQTEKAADRASPKVKNNSPASQMESLVNKTSNMELSGRRTRSGRLFRTESEGAARVGKGDRKPGENAQGKAATKKRTCSERDKPVFQFEVPCSQDEISTRKRKKFSEPKDRFR